MTLPPPGTVLARYAFGVDASKAREAALALKTTDAAWRELHFRDLAGQIVPPTFTTVSSFHWDRAEVFGERLGMALDRSLHGSSRWDFSRPLVVGDELSGELTFVEERTAQGRRAGRLRLLTVRCSFRDATGTLVATETFTFVEAAVLPPVALPAEAPAEAAAAALPGEAVRVYGPVTRTDFARYAGACGDFSVVHLDETVARAAGNPTVFAMGLFHGGMLGLHAAESRAATPIRHLRLRWTDRVWPGDHLILSARPVGEHDAALTASTTTGRVVVQGSASFAAPAAEHSS